MFRGRKTHIRTYARVSHRTEKRMPRKEPYCFALIKSNPRNVYKTVYKTDNLQNFTKDYQTITIDFLLLVKSLIVSLFFSHFDLHHWDHVELPPVLSSMIKGAAWKTVTRTHL